MKILWPYLRRFLKQWRIMALGLLLGIATLAAGIALLSLSGWFLSAAALAGGSLATAKAFNYLMPSGGVRFLSIARTASRYGERLATHEATFRLLSELRVWLWRGLLPQSARRLAPLRSADLLNRLIADVDALDHLYLRLATPLAAIAVMLPLLFVFVAGFDPLLAGLLCGILLVAAIALPWLFYRLGAAPGRAVHERRRQLRIALLDYLQGQAELAVFGAAPRIRAQVDGAADDWLDSQRQMAAVGAFSQALTLAVGGVLLLAMLIAAIGGVGSAVPPGPLLALVVFLALASFELLMPLAAAFQHLTTCIQAAERLDEMVAPGDSIAFPVASAAAASGALSLAGVAFAYRPEMPVLRDVDLEIAAGSKVALLGPTGSGKSSLLGLLTREWQPDAGTLRLDGRPLDSYAENELRRAMSVMSQRVHLFAASLRDNLTLALPPGSAVDDARLGEVLRAVGLESLLAGAGLEAWIGDGGRRLSGGEQRRIGVARVLLRDAPLILLDEPGEGLDLRTEREIIDLLLQAAAGKTLLMITHRQVGLERMDAVYELAEGKLRRR